MRKRVLALFLIAAMTAFTFAGCASGPVQTTESGAAAGTATAKDSGIAKTEESKVKLVFWKAPHNENEAGIWAPVLENFMNDNPDIEIEHLVTPWETWAEKYTSAFAGGAAPDISYMTEGFPQFADAGQLADLSGFAPADIADKMAGYTTAYYDGKLVGISFIVLASVLAYNIDMLEAAGVEPPKTWEELRETAKLLTTDSVHGFGADVTNAYPHLIGQFTMQSGGNLLTSDFSALDFGTPDQQRGLQLLYDMMWVDGSIPKWDDYTQDELTNLFPNEKIAMTIIQAQDGKGYLEKNPNLNMSIAPVPEGPATDDLHKKANYGGIGFLSIAEQCQYKEQAWRFVEYMSINGGAKDYLSKVGFFSGFDDVNQEMYAGDPYMEIAQQAVSNMFVFPVSPYFMGEVTPELYSMSEAIFRQGQDIPSAYEAANKAVMEILAQ